jgi:ferredoxin-NADP reductase
MTITPPQRLQARLVDKQVLNDIFTIFRFEMVQPHRFTFDAGQYLSLKVHPNGTRRSYSLWSDPSNAHGFELFVEATSMYNFLFVEAKKICNHQDLIFE